MVLVAKSFCWRFSNAKIGHQHFKLVTNTNGLQRRCKRPWHKDKNRNEDSFWGWSIKIDEEVDLSIYEKLWMKPKIAETSVVSLYGSLIKEILPEIYDHMTSFFSNV